MRCNSSQTISMIVLSLFFSVLSAFARPANATDWWTMFHHDSLNTGYSTSEAPSTGDTLWSYATIGNLVYSSPAIVDGKVYVGSSDRRLYCLDALTGDFIWSYFVAIEPGEPSAIGTSPAVVDGHVYFGAYDSTLYCLNAEDGSFVWSYKTGGYVMSSPTVASGRVYFGSHDYNVYCLNASTGAYIWSYPTGGSVVTSPAVTNGRVYVGAYDLHLYCLNASTGAYIWSYSPGGHASTATIHDGKVYVVFALHGLNCLDAVSGAYIWHYPSGAMQTQAAPAVAYGRVYCVETWNYVWDYIMYCVDASTGTLEWSFLTGDHIRNSPAVADSMVYFGSEDYNIYCLDAFSGAVVWSDTLDHKLSIASFSVALGNVYVPSGFGNKLYAYGPPPECSVAPTFLDFGTVNIGDYNDTTFTLRNYGGGLLSGAVSESCDHYDIVFGGGSYDLAANDSVVVTVRFEPTAAGTLTCTIETGSDICDSVYCTGIGEPLPACDVYPPVLDFGNVNIGESASMAFTITNTGGQLLTGYVSESAAYYSITSGGGAYSLSAGQFRMVTVQFSPTSEGMKSCTIETGSALCSDVSCVGNGSLAVELASFTATQHEDNVEVVWTTATEINNAGFNIYRSLENGGEKRRLNEELIPAEGDELSGATYSFIDVDIAQGVMYEYWMEDVDLSGNGLMHGPVSICLEENDQIPLASSLAQNYPNPFNPLTEIRYDIHASCHVRLEVYTALGNLVTTLVDECQEAGSKNIVWDGRNSGGQEVSSGIYFYRLRAGSFTAVRKMILLK